MCCGGVRWCGGCLWWVFVGGCLWWVFVVGVVRELKPNGRTKKDSAPFLSFTSQPTQPRRPTRIAVPLAPIFTNHDPSTNHTLQDHLLLRLQGRGPRAVPRLLARLHGPGRRRVVSTENADGTGPGVPGVDVRLRGVRLAADDGERFCGLCMCACNACGLDSCNSRHARA